MDQQFDETQQAATQANDVPLQDVSQTQPFPSTEPVQGFQTPGLSLH